MSKHFIEEVFLILGCRLKRTQRIAESSLGVEETREGFWERSLCLFTIYHKFQEIPVGM